MNADLNITIKIPIRYYLKLFLAKKKEVEPFILTNRSCHISALIMEPMKKGGYVPPREKIPIYYNSILEISINTAIAKEGRFLIEKDVVLRIDSNLKSWFDDELTHWVKREQDLGREINDSLFKFMEYYGIEEDELSHDAVKKMYYRARFPRVKIKKETPEELRSQLTFQF